MNKPGPWKCPWTSSKKQKKQTKNKNTAVSKQPKVDLAASDKGGLIVEAMAMGSSQQKIESRAEKGIVMIVQSCSF